MSSTCTLLSTYEPYCIETMKKIKKLEPRESQVSRYKYVKDTLDSISYIDSKIPDNPIKYSTPARVPETTSASYTEWYKKKMVSSTLNKANTCLFMRVESCEKRFPR